MQQEPVSDPVTGEVSTISEEWLQRVVDNADLDVLRLTLYQVTGEQALWDVPTERIPMRGGMYFIPTVAERARPEVKKLAVKLLRALPDQPPPPPPEKSAARQLMEALTEEPLSDTEFEFGYEQLGFADFPRDVSWTQGRPPSASSFNVAVIGGGISGIATAIQLKRLGIPYTVYERQDGVGGTWCLNTYPEARVDTGIFLYQFTFEKNYPWRHPYATQAEVKEYLEYVAEKYDVLSDFRFGIEITDARWDEGEAKWILQAKSSDGTTHEQEVNAIITATGLFSKPKPGAFDGMDEFKGEVCHTASWNPNMEIEGKRVCLVGTGSTGVQISRHLAQHALHLTIIQRTPSWIGPVVGYKREFTPEERWLFDNVPYYWNWYSYQAFAAGSMLQAGQEHDFEWQAGGGSISKANDNLRAFLTEYIETKLEGHPDLIEKCTPKYAPLGRRLVVDNGWFETLLRPNVDFVTAGVDRFVPKGIITTEGGLEECEVAVLAIGWETSRYFWPIRFEGRNGLTLEELWSRDGGRSYLGMAMPGFPNLFTLYGPNSAPRAGGAYSWSEVWSRYSVDAVIKLIESGKRSMEVKADKYSEYNLEIDTVMEGLIWKTQGVGSYQLNEYGRPGFSCPFRIDQYHSHLIEPELNDYELRP
jgi:4-hydroxyacetophenone monooxygenase